MRLINEHLQIFLHMFRRVIIGVVKSYHNRRCAIRVRYLATLYSALHMRHFTGHMVAPTRAPVITPDFAVVGANVGKQDFQVVTRIGGKGTLVVGPIRRTQHRYGTADDGHEIGQAVAERLLQRRIAQLAMIGMSQT